MSRGFTLLEMLITVVVLGVLLAVAAPNFSSMSSSSKMTRLAPEVHGFLLSARSEAVFRNQSLYVHFVVSSSSTAKQNASGDWQLVLTDGTNYSSSNKLLVLDGSPYNDVTVQFSYSNQKYFEIDGIRGRLANGNVKFYPNALTSQWLQVKSAYKSGRVRICSNDPDPNASNTVGFYNYAIC